MPQITKLKLQKNKRVVNIFIDNKFTTSLKLTTVAKIKLKVGMDISNHDLKASMMPTPSKLGGSSELWSIMRS